MDFREIELKQSYTGMGEVILNEFLLPLLNNSILYDRITSYYSIESLLAISHGIESLYGRNGKMRLIVGAHSIPSDLIDATLQKEYLKKQIEQMRNQIINDIISITNALEKDRLVTLAWMIQDGLLEVKAASVIGNGIFHPKTFIFTDENENEVVAIGSPNETRSGLGGNFEQVLVVNSWENYNAVSDQKTFFNNLWDNELNDVIVKDISMETSEMIVEAIGDDFHNHKRKTHNGHSVDNIINESSRMPSNFFVSGDIPALYMHQERAVIDALSRWPVRVLLADEVGLGKTFEAAATLVFLVKYCNVKRVLILTPKSVLQQWQDELSTNFGLDVWLYNSSNRQYISSKNEIINMDDKNPIGNSSPNMMLISSQYARGSKSNNSLFEKDDVVLPDLLIVDEAHSARISQDLSGNPKKTRMYCVLEKVSSKIPHLILATATPMFKSASEYHAMLKILGLPKAWQKEKNYQMSLDAIGSNKILDLSDARVVGILLVSTIRDMKPKTSNLSNNELKLIENLQLKYEQNDKIGFSTYVRDNWTIFREVFIKFHPAHLLTVRNTRRSLVDFGYKFPQRNLIEVNISNSMKKQLFDEDVRDYIANQCFSIERILSVRKRINLSFIRINYQQRIVSSLYSCNKSLKRRHKKVSEYLEKLQSLEFNLNDDLKFSSDTDDLDSDEILNCDIDDNFFDDIDSSVDLKKLKDNASSECACLSSLIHRCNEIINSDGDLKIVESIKIALEKLHNNDLVLLFSRYTDTIDALIVEFKKVRADEEFVYGIYTGNKAVIIKNGNEEACDKVGIKKELFSGRLKILFCSDAASEGLNLQAARILINVDVPWTPARLEQRIGRIARLGQKADEVFVYNVWYPNSIEAKMYRRIQSRLQNANLAIGEFPDVIAEKIKRSIFENSNNEDNSLQELLDFRNNKQTKALEKLWANENKMYSISKKIRKLLMKLCSQSFEYMENDSDGTLRKYMMPDGKVVELSSESGMAESISLKSYPWTFIDYKLNSLVECFDQEGNPSVFVNAENEDSYFKHENIFDLIFDADVKDFYYCSCFPNMLPDFTSLDLTFINENFHAKAPNLWPYLKEENNES